MSKKLGVVKNLSEPLKQLQISDRFFIFVMLGVTWAMLSSRPGFATPLSIRTLEALQESTEGKLDADEEDRGGYETEVEGWQSGSKKRVVLYVGPGAWSHGRRFFERFLRAYGFSYRTVGPKGLLKDGLDPAKEDALIMPGGKSWIYLRDLKNEGAQRIRDFVEGGGGYFGVCEGAYYATSHRLGRDMNEEYGIGLLDGVAYDGNSFKDFEFKNGMHWFTLLLEGWKSYYKILMLGGPSFRFTEAERVRKNLQVVADFSYGRQEPGMVHFQYGKGRVFLSGPHPEIEEKKFFLGIPYRDPDSEWPLMNRVLLDLKKLRPLAPEFN